MTDVFPGATLIQLVEWGYPMGQMRPTPDPALAFSVIHITANLASAENEAAYRLNNAELQNSATFFLNQDGSAVQCLGDPLHMDPWTNGDVNRPDMGNPRIAHMVASSVNANERSLVTIENVGREPAAPISPAQEAQCAQIIAYYHAKAGVPVNRQTVIGHYQINSVDRPNCPGVDKSVIDRIVALATEDEMAPGSKQAGTPIGTFAWSGGGHLLISPSNPSIRFLQSLNPGPFQVVASLNLKDPVSGVAVDIDGRSPPVNNRDQVYLVDAPPFGAAAYVLRQDGTFTPTPSVPAAPVGPTAREAADAVAAAAAGKAAEF